MKSSQRLWTRDELIQAISLYVKIPFGKLHHRNPEIISLAKKIDRTPGSVSYKLVNLASLDPTLKLRGIKGASNASKLDKEVWDEFYGRWEILAQFDFELNREIKASPSSQDILTIPLEGKEKESLVRVRVNQQFFRKMVLAAYDGSCCITGINHPSLLVAGHISPWGDDEKNRMNPRNGIAINALHDRAFEFGLLTILPDYSIRVSGEIKELYDGETIDSFFKPFDGKKIREPQRFPPDPEFLYYHSTQKFIQ
ncbi:MAG: HNH endonuclease [Bacteroidetes bacterium]|nr:HNH endonuclease [Bacteroidota bacterium]